jgi:hypothetical protein
MSQQGGTFEMIISEPGSIRLEDKLLMADSVLRDQIKRLRAQKAETYGEQSREAVPTLAELSKTHYVYFHQTYKPFAAMGFGWYKATPDQSSIQFNTNVQFRVPIFGDMLGACVAFIELSNLQAVDASDRSRYCEFPGHKIFQEVTMKVGGMPLDTYYDYNHTFYYNSAVGNDRIINYRRMVGQEDIKTATLTTDPVRDEYRFLLPVADGAQTLKRTHELLQMWVPLLFWFSENEQNALPLWPLEEAGDLLIDYRLVERDQFVFGTTYGGPGAVAGPLFKRFELYTKQFYINAEVLDLMKERFGVSLIRTRRTKISTYSTSDIYLDLNYFKFPIERLEFMLVLNDYEKTADKWERGTLLTNVEYRFAVPLFPTGAPPVSQLGYTQAQSFQETPLVDEMTLSVNGQQLYYEQEESFFNAYTPFIQDGSDIVAPRERGFYVIPFNQYQHDHQPSGYVIPNGEPGNELFMQSSVIQSDIPAKLIASATSINFLVYTKSTMRLKLV